MYLLLKGKCVVIDSFLRVYFIMGDLQAQTDQGSSMFHSHHSILESSSIHGMSRVNENTHENTIPNRCDVTILEDGEMELSQDGIEMVSSEEEINAESADKGEFQSLYNNINNFQRS